MIGDRPTGLGVYATHCLRIIEYFRSRVIVRGGFNIGRSDIEIIPAPRSIGFDKGTWAAFKRLIWMRSLKFGDGYLVYSPTHHGLPRQNGQIITIHDMICLRHPRQHVLQYIFFKFLIPRMLRKCRAVFTVSHASRADIISTYKYPGSDIYVVPNSINTEYFYPGLVDIDSPYLLMVGARYSHKNVDELLRNSSLWIGKYRLIVTSCSGGYRKFLEKIIRKLGVEQHVEFRDYVSKEELLKLYQGCTALIYPSKWEGFGIPPLEALACGRPVIVSDIEVHKEVLGDAGIFVKLGDSEDWQKAFAQIEDENIVKNKVILGSQRISFYSVENSLAALKASLLAVAPDLERV